MTEHGKTIFTIGHSTRTLDEVVDMLRRTGVDELVDVRAFPSSRAYPQWNQDALRASLPPDVGYRWIRRLGGRRHSPAGVESPNDGWRVRAFRDYADYMATDQFAEGLDELLATADTSSPAIMCSEAVPWRCHRRLITDALLVRGVHVRHVMSATQTTTATLTPFAHVDGLRITYPPTERPRPLP